MITRRKPFALETFERGHLLVGFARVVRPARDDVERNGISFVGNDVAFFCDCNCSAGGSENDCFHSRGFGGVAKQPRAFDVNVVHLARVFAFARDFAGEVIDLADAFDGALVVVGVGD